MLYKLCSGTRYSDFNHQFSVNICYNVSFLQFSTNSLEKIPVLGKIEGRRRRGLKKMRWLNSITLWTGISANSMS